LSTANSIAKLRKKIKAGIASTLEQSEVEQWEREHPRGRRPKSKTSTPESASQTNPETQGQGTGGASESGSPTIHNELPGSGIGHNLPPIDMSTSTFNSNANASGAGTNSNASSQPNFASHATTNSSSTSPPPNGPAMSAKEAEASADMVAGVVTKILSEVNDSNRSHGFPAIGEQLIGLFHFSVKRMCIRYGAAVDEEAMDATVVIGISGFVGFNSWKAYKKAQDEPTFATKNTVENQPPKPPEKVSVPSEQPRAAAPPNNNGYTAPAAPIIRRGFLDATKGGIF
jgi:hypothetical protein